MSSRPSGVRSNGGASPAVTGSRSSTTRPGDPMDLDYVLLASVIITVGSFFLTVVTGTGLVRQVAGRRRAVRVPGVVVDVRTRDSGTARAGRRPTTYAPVLAFRTTDGREVQTESRVASNPPVAEAGQRVRVAYDPRDPAEAYVDTARGAGVVAYAAGFAIALFVLVIAASALLARLS
ncbi:MAG: DUF3592 domain-containing protein [Streptosporangiales bacterium]|nr:DUF3592 domain-containing protein [Streptosporangiales bacterium]